MEDNMGKRLALALCGMVLLPLGAQAAGSTIALWTDRISFNPSVVLRKDVTARAAWHKVVPRKYAKVKWVYDLEGTFNPPKLMSENGTVYAVGGACKPHDCGNNNVYYVIEPGGHHAYGAILLIRNNVPTYEYFGKADPLQHEWLREEIVDTEHALGINGVVH
jgi:Inhibitor of vertebrate lysozyme (Ivy)